jgi:hypothetical protein
MTRINQVLSHSESLVIPSHFDALDALACVGACVGFKATVCAREIEMQARTEKYLIQLCRYMFIMLS